METREICEQCGAKKVFLLTTWACPTLNCGVASSGTVITTGTTSTMVGISTNTITMKDCWFSPGSLQFNPVNDPPSIPLETARAVEEEIDPNKDSTKLVIHDWMSSSLFSTLEIDSHHQGSNWNLFEYMRSQAIPESGEVASAWHTNIPRPGSCGLPHGWAAVVNGWRISSDWSFENPIIRKWAFNTKLEFIYRHKTFYQLPLSDFLEKGTIGKQIPDVEFDMSPGEANQVIQLEGDKFGLETVTLRENLDYSVRVESCPSATADLRRYLAGDWMDSIRFTPELVQSGVPSPRDYPRFRDRWKDVQKAVSKLDTIIGMNGNNSTTRELEKVRQLLVPSRTFSLRVHLNCALRKMVV